MSDDVPQHVIEAEYTLWGWGTASPVDCMEASKDKNPRDKLNIFKHELKYHMGAFFAAESICNSLYALEGLDNRQYPEHHPPWMEESIEYQKELQEVIDDDE